MLAAERWERIEQLVNERGSIRVTELSDIFQVTEETIRRDLDKLEGEGKLLRSHGGAVKVRSAQPQETSYTERETLNAEEKRCIAREAVSHISENDRIILDASSTAWYMSQLMPDLPLTVLTNSLKVALELSGKERIQVISTGGLLTSRSLSYVGPLVERSLNSYHVDKAFISCKGLHHEHGLSESNELQASVKTKMIAISDRTYLLADSSKFGLRAFAHVAGWGQIDCLITDTKADPQLLEELRARPIDVIQAT